MGGHRRVPGFRGLGEVDGMTDINESVDMTTGVRTVVVDNGDGTGTRTTFHLDGTINTVEHLTDLPIPDLPADPDLIPPDPTRLRSPR